MEPTGFSPPQVVDSPEGIAVSSGSVGTTPEPPAKTSRVEGGAVATAGRVPVACAVSAPQVVVHRTDRTRTRDERSQAAVSVSSTGATARAELILSREIARKRRERLEAEEEELEIERQIAACSSKRSSAGSVRSDKASERGSPEHGTANLTRQSLLQHELESQSVRSERARVLLVPKAAAVARIAENLPFAAAGMSPVPVFPMDMLDSPPAAERLEANDASRDPLRHVAVAKAASGSSPGQEFLSFSADAEEVEQEDADMYEDCVAPQAAQAFYMRVQEVVTNATTHVAAAEARACEAELRARASELQASEKVAR